MDLKEGVQKLLDAGASTEGVARAVLEIEQDQLWEAAVAVHAEFMGELNYSRNNLPPSLQARYGFKIERRAAGVSLRWVRFTFFGPKNKRRRIDRAVPRGKASKYSLASFPEAQTWERDLIRQIEEKAAPLRVRSAQLARLAKMVANLKPHGRQTSSAAAEGSAEDELEPA